MCWDGKHSTVDAAAHVFNARRLLIVARCDEERREASTVPESSGQLMIDWDVIDITSCKIFMMGLTNSGMGARRYLGGWRALLRCIDAPPHREARRCIHSQHNFHYLRSRRSFKR